MVWFVLFFVILSAVGWLFQAIAAKHDEQPFLEKVFLSPAIGTALTGSIVLFWLVAFDRFPAAILYILPALLLALWAGTVLCSRGGRTSPGSGAPGIRSLEKADQWFLLLAAAFSVLLLVITMKEGAGGDYLFIWGSKALLLWDNDTLRIPSLMDPESSHHHKDYPLLFPGLQALFYRFAGSVLDRTVKVLYPLLLLSTSLVLYFNLRRRFKPGAAVVGGGLCLMTPAVCGHHPGVCSAYMDIPLGCFIVLAFLSGLDWLREGRVFDGLKAGLFLAAVSLTKNEGTAAAAVAALLLFFGTARRGLGRRALGLAAILLPLAVMGGAWLLFRSHLHPGGGDFMALLTGPALIEGLPKLPAVAGRFLLEFLHFERWGFLWILAAATAPWWARREGALAGLFLVAMIALHLAAMMVSPLEVHYQMDTAAARLPGQLAPLVAACCGWGIGGLMAGSGKSRTGGIDPATEDRFRRAEKV